MLPVQPAYAVPVVVPRRSFQGQFIPACGDAIFDITFAPVPEPASLALLGVGLAGLGIIRRRKST